MALPAGLETKIDYADLSQEDIKLIMIARGLLKQNAQKVME